MKNKREGLTSVQLRPEIVSRIKRYVRQGASKSEIINEALRQYLIEREFQEIRRQLAPLAQAKGIYTDEDVERALR
jgi:Arc/MetJ-type ribon-helix-helix transcriptional regulator